MQNCNAYVSYYINLNVKQDEQHQNKFANIKIDNWYIYSARLILSTLTDTIDILN